jgi:hypothetical protein
MNRHIYIRVVLAMIILISSGKAQNFLHMNAVAEKYLYIVGEPIQIAISIKNNSASVSYDNLRCTAQLTLANENGETVAPAGIPFCYPFEDYLGANMEAYTVVELNAHFGNGYGSMVTAHHYFDEGKYILTVLFRPPHLQADSVKIPIQIMAPTGEERNVYDTFLDLIKGWPKKYTSAQLTDGLKTLHKNHPNSVYTPVILTVLEATYEIFLGNLEKSLEVRKELVEKYPFSIRGQGMLDGILKRMSSDSERIEFLKKIRGASKGSLMEKVNEKKIEIETAKEAH